MLKKLIKRLQEKKQNPLPHVSSPYNLMVKRTQQNFLFTFLLLLGFTSIYTYFYVEQKIEREQLVRVYAAKTEITPPKTLEKNDLVLLRISKKSLPTGYFEVAKENPVLGKTLVREVVKNEILLPHHLQIGIDPDSVSAQFEEFFAFTMDEDWFQAKLPNLKTNDLIDVVVSNPKQDLEASQIIVEAIKVIAIQTKNNKRTVVVNVTTDEAKSILFVRGLRLPMQILVRSSWQEN